MVFSRWTWALVIATMLYAENASSLRLKKIQHGSTSTAIIPPIHLSKTLRIPEPATQPAGSQRHACVGKLVYRTSSFVAEAHKASNTMLNLPGGGGIALHWELVPATRGPVSNSAWDSYVSFYNSAYPADSDASYCVVLVEIAVLPPESGNPSRIAGVANVCGACGWANAAYVLSGMHPTQTLSVILHEVGHILCADHLPEGETGIMDDIAGSTVFTKESSATMLQALDNLHKSNQCEKEPTPDLMGPLGAPATPGEDGHCHGSHHAHYDDYDEAVGVTLIIFFSLVFFSLTWWLCLSPPY